MRSFFYVVGSLLKKLERKKLSNTTATLEKN
ncbi:hypothetical protein BC952_0146 [Flavobacterium limicola]|uniref:Uncharacterized protein n=1 Tax=Flavobacterium limicola TaxID=180441 RepID=A0A495S5Y5_9FLAO|nr:hypothetical protein BC952_0146 [Flavobacterium limicola]